MLKIVLILCVVAVQPWQSAGEDIQLSSEENLTREERRWPWQPPPILPPPPVTHPHGNPNCPVQLSTEHVFGHFHSPNRIPVAYNCGMHKLHGKRQLMDIFKQDEEKSKRVVGGVMSVEGQWPWIVSLNVVDRRIPNGHFCGGTLISNRWVLTAAHCFAAARDQPCRHWVQIGENTVRGHSMDRQTITIDKIIKHPGFTNKIGLIHDIALLRLSRRVNLNTRDANVACLLTPHEQYDKHSCTVAGWGKTQTGSQGPTSNVLRHLRVGQLETHICRARVPPHMLPPGQICINSAHGRDACQGDSGGPMVCRNNRGKWVLIGVTSHGGHPSTLCALNAPAMYTEVKSYLGWIEGVIARNGGA